MTWRRPFQFLDLCAQLGVKIVNLSAGSPYYNPHIQRPAAYPPSDGYQPPEDPLVGVARQINVVRQLKARAPKSLVLVGTAYSYLQEYLPHVAQHVLRNGWADLIGIGRMVLSYPTILADAIGQGTLSTKSICRTFSDCTTAPRNGLVSGCYPLDRYYAAKPEFQKLKADQDRFGPSVSWQDLLSCSKRIGATLAFSYLFASHAAFEFVEGLGWVRQALRGGKSKPFIGLNGVLWDAVPFAMNELARPETQSAAFRVVCFHKLPYANLWNGGGYTGEGWVRDDWVPLFQQYHVDAVINGHTHAYNRGVTNGVTYLVVGGGGGELDTERVAFWPLYTVEYSRYHYGLMQVSGHTLTWNAFDNSDQLLDSFTLQSRVPLLEWKSSDATGGLLPLAVTGKPGTTCVLERSGDLVAWNAVATNAIPASGLPTATNLIPVTASGAFFRAWAEP